MCTREQSRNPIILLSSSYEYDLIKRKGSFLKANVGISAHHDLHYALEAGGYQMILSNVEMHLNKKNVIVFSINTVVL